MTYSGRLATVLALCATLVLPAGQAVAEENDSSRGLAAPVAEPAEAKADLADLEDEVMCPICGTALGLSESPQADRQRVFIRELIADGMTKDQIKDELVAEYGPNVLATPSTEGFDLAAWVVPGAAILAGGGAIVVGLRRWRRVGTARSSGSKEPEPSPADEERLSADLARYDL